MVKLFDRVKETTNTVGKGDLFLNGPLSSFASFSEFYQDNDELFYFVSDGKFFEIGRGKYNLNNSISRIEVFVSTSDNNLVNWNNKTKEIYVTYPSQRFVDTLSENQTFNAGVWQDDHSLSGINTFRVDNNTFQLTSDASGNLFVGQSLEIDNNEISFLNSNLIQTLPFQKNTLLDQTNIDNFLSLSGELNNQIGLNIQSSGTFLRTFDDQDYPQFGFISSGDIGQIDARNVKYSPSFLWEPCTARGVELSFDAIVKNLQVNLQQIPDFITASGGNVDTLDFLDSSAFARSEHVNDILGIERFVTTEQEFNEAQIEANEPEEIFNDWFRFSHDISNTFPAIPSETGTWRFDNQENFVASIINSNSYIGFVSIDSFDQYNFEATLRSNAGVVPTFPGTNGNFLDNDQIGLVAAFDIDPITSQERTLSVIVNREAFFPLFPDISINGSIPGFFIVYNFRQLDQIMLVGENYYEPMGVTNNDFNTAWATQYPSGIRIRIERDQDIIRAYRSDFNDPENIRTEPGQFLEINLNDIPELSVFKGPKQYGFSCLSQYDSQFINIDFADLSNDIYNLLDNTVYTFSEDLQEWLPNSEATFDDAGVETFIQNPDTESLFYLKNRNEIEPVSRKPPQIKINDSVEISERVYTSGIVNDEDYFYETRAGGIRINQDDMVGYTISERVNSLEPSAIVGDSGNIFETDTNEGFGELPVDMFAFRTSGDNLFFDVNVSGEIKTLNIGLLA